MVSTRKRHDADGSALSDKLSAENKFAVHEHWHSPEDIEAHFQEDHFKKFAEELQPHLAGPNALSIGKYHSVSLLSFQRLPSLCGRVHLG